MKVTHKRRARLARCIQWSDETTEEIIKILGNDASLFDEKFIIIRTIEGIKTIKQGYWVVVGEDNAVRVYSPKQFEIKYEEIE